MVEEKVEKKLRVAVLEAAKLLSDNGLGDWQLKLNNKRTSLAETDHTEKTIHYSKHFLVVADREQLTGVTLHEAAHALVGQGHGHNEVFVKKCKEISPNEDYAQRAVSIPLRKYILTCPKCGQTGSNNLNKPRYCGKCFNNNKEMVAFDIKENKLKVRSL